MPELSAELIWEDDASTTPAWWLSRATHNDRQFFIAPDPITHQLLALTRVGAVPHEVVAVAGGPDVDRATALTELKARVGVLAATPIVAPGSDVTRWKVRRFVVSVVQQLPLTLASFAIGGVIGGAAGLFSVATDLIGWPMLVVGVALGAAAGPILKFMVERWRPGTFGAWARFAIATLAAAAGAIAVLGTILTMFWN